jgi:polysaccharide transporter, PST family
MLTKLNAASLKVNDVGRFKNNLIFLYLYQGSSLLLPLITMPFLVRQLGTAEYGMIGVALAFGAYLQSFIDFGFNTTATKSISCSRENVIDVIEIHTSVVVAKIGLAIVGLSGLLSLTLALPSYRTIFSAILPALIAAVAQSFSPVWVYQGLEKVSRIAIQSLITRVIWVVFIVLYVRGPGDIPVLLWGSVLLYTAATSYAWLDVFIKYKIRIGVPNFGRIKRTVIDGAYLFASQIGVIAFGQSNVLILGAFSSPEMIGRYVIAEKIIRAAIGMTGPIGTVIFPVSARLLSESKSDGIRMLRKLLLTGSGVFLLGAILLVLLAGKITLFVTGSVDAEIVFLVRLMAIIPLFVFVDNVYGTQLLLNMGFARQFMYTTLIAGVISLCIQFFLVPKYHDVGAAWSFMIGQFVVLALFVIQIRREKMDPLSQRWSS